jgi:pimeloyl-ACP methyl ester carboxylesterase
MRQGYHVVLWNYRGYGESTGTPSISRSQEDALAVYHFYRSKGYQIEVVHGYSIGGAAAVGLMDRLAKEPQLPGDRVRVLIVDRSFSSIGEMSIEFGKAIYNLTRVIFFTDNIDLSRQF